MPKEINLVNIRPMILCTSRHGIVVVVDRIAPLAKLMSIIKLFLHDVASVILQLPTRPHASSTRLLFPYDMHCVFVVMFSFNMKIIYN